MRWPNLITLIGSLHFTPNKNNSQENNQPLPYRDATEYIEIFQKEKTPKHFEDSTLTIEERVLWLNGMHNYDLSTEDYIFLTRIIAKEAGFDPKAYVKGHPEQTMNNLKKGWEAVAEVILNRYLFDKKHDSHYFGKKHSLEAIGRAPKQFHPVMLSPEYFDPQTFKNKDGKANLHFRNLHHMDEINDALFQVLKQEKEDPTHEALYFHADYVYTDPKYKYGREIGDFALRLKNGTICRIDSKVQYNTHVFFGTDCPLAPYSVELREEEYQEYIAEKKKEKISILAQQPTV